MKKILEIKNLSKKFGWRSNAKIVLKKINLVLYEGEIISLIGENGAGKTTLFNLIMGFDNYLGKINFGFEYKKHPSEKISIVFQKTDCPDDLKVCDIVNFAIQNELNNKIDKAFINNLYQTLKIDAIINSKFSVISGGEMQRVLIFIALIKKPKIILLDEFTNNLDLFTRKTIQSYIQEYCLKYQASAIVVSHSPEEICLLSNRILFLYDGEIYGDNLEHKKWTIEEIEAKFQSLNKMPKNQKPLIN